MFAKLITYTVDLFLCVAIAPAGVLKIAQRMMQRKQDLARGGVKLMVVGGIFMMLFVSLMMDAPLRSNPFTYMYSSAGVIGLVLGVRTFLKGKKYEKYKGAVTHQNLMSAHEIANYVGLAEHAVVRDLLTMIGDGMFPALRFNAQTRRLELNDATKKSMFSRAVECDSCGAKVTVYEGIENKCEYCGDALSY
jgi:hypothetical protein